jgi:hypothetical protein
MNQKEGSPFLTLCLLLTHRHVILCPYALRRPRLQGVLGTVSGIVAGRGKFVCDSSRYRCQPAGLACRYRGVRESRMAIASIERHSRERAAAV